MIRTGILFCIGKIISSQHSLQNVKTIIGGILRHLNLQELRTGRLYEAGLDHADFWIILTGCVILTVVSWRQEKGSIREAVSRWHCLPRWIFYGVSAVVVLLLGVYGESTDNISFAYMYF